MCFFSVSSKAVQLSPMSLLICSEREQIKTHTHKLPAHHVVGSPDCWHPYLGGEIWTQMRIGNWTETRAPTERERIQSLDVFKTGLIYWFVCNIVVGKPANYQLEPANVQFGPTTVETRYHVTKQLPA